MKTIILTILLTILSTNVQASNVKRGTFTSDGQYIMYHERNDYQSKRVCHPGY